MRFVCGADFMSPIIIVKDWKWYVENGEEIETWADKCTPGWKLTGMILSFKSDEDRLAFLLRWD